jgi:glycine hydroxymethyltransferase
LKPRIGTPAMTTRGFKELEAERVANMIADVLDAPSDEAVIARVRDEARALCQRFPVYPAAAPAGAAAERAA